MYDVIIIGGGPAGASAAIYTARGNLKTLVIDKAPNTGALALTHKIANYPGAEGEMTGKELLDIMRRQAESFGATFLQTTITAVDVEDEVKSIYTADGTFEAKAVIVANPTERAQPHAPWRRKAAGPRHQYLRYVRRSFYQGKSVAVIGDSEEALEEAHALTKFADKIVFIVPRAELQGVDEVPELPKTEFLFRTRPVEIVGEQSVEGVQIRHADGREELVSVDGVFIFLSGSKPGTDFLEDQVPLDDEGFMILDEFMQSSVPGVFGAGEVRKTPVKQAVVAAADGAIAAMAVDRYINKRSKIVPQYK